MSFYKNMTAEEQLDWVTKFSAFCKNGLLLLEEPGWSDDCDKAMIEGLELLMAFDFAQRFALNTLRIGDFQCRVVRLRHYVEQIKETISANTTVVGADGTKYAYIPALQQQKRRGRPSAEQKANQKDADSASTKVAQKIAELSGREIITAQPQREKNNEELAQEKAEREAEEAKQQPSLFTASPESTDNPETPASPENSLTSNLSPLNSTLSPLTSEERLHLSELKFLMSEDLARDVDNIRMLRGQAASAAEHAKALAEQGAKASDIAPYAQEAANYTEQYENIYGRVDAEMAEVYVRLCEDEKFKAEWAKKADVASLKKWTKPYLAKMSEGFADTIRKKIADEQPEVVAAKEQAKADKKEVAAIRKYLLRTDKPNTAKRIKGMEEKYKRLVELIGEEEAKAYIPVIEKAKEELRTKTSNL